MIDEGSRAPDFDLPTDEGGNVRLSQLLGSAVVVYFYPKDDTSGCTVEAKDFSALAAEFADFGVAVVGVSPDSVASHARRRTWSAWIQVDAQTCGWPWRRAYPSVTPAPGVTAATTVTCRAPASHP